MDLTLERWKKRNLTLFGKITVLKSLVLSKLIYPLSIMKLPSDEFIENMEKKFLDFVWDSKRPKLNTDILIQPTHKGGLAFPKLKYFIFAQKFNWIKRLLDNTNNAKWKLFHKKKLKQTLGISDFETLFLCNINYGDAVKIFENSLLGELIRVWSLTNFKTVPVTDVDVILNQIIWINSNMIPKGNQLINPTLAAKGLIRVKDLINDQGSLMNIIEFTNKIEYYNFLDGLHVLNSIPKGWLNVIRENFNNIDLNYEESVPTGINSKSAYNRFIEKYINYNTNKLTVNWTKKLKDEDINIDWDLIFRSTSKLSLLSKIRSFIFRFLHGILYSDLRLYLSNISKSTLCTFCSKDIGDFLHNYWQCTIIQSFIAETMHWFNTAMGTNLRLDVKLYLFGSYTRERRLDIFTEHFFWIIKWYLHCCRQANNNPSLVHFKVFLAQIQNDEKFYAIKLDKLDLHQKKWLVPGRNLNLNNDV